MNEQQLELLLAYIDAKFQELIYPTCCATSLETMEACEALKASVISEEPQS